MPFQFSKNSHCIVGFLLAIFLVRFDVAMYSVYAQENEQAGPEDCVIQINAPDGLDVKISGKSIGDQRTIRSKSLDPGKYYRTTLSYTDKELTKNETLVIKAGWNVKIDLSCLEDSVERIPYYAGHVGKVSASRFSKNKELLFTGGSDGRVIFWDVRTNNPINGFATRDAVKSLTLSDDEELILVETGKRSSGLTTGISLRRLSNNEELWSKEFPNAECTTVCFGQDSHNVAVGHKDGAISILGSDGMLYANIKKTNDPIVTISYQPKTSMVAFTSQNYSVPNTHKTTLFVIDITKDHTIREIQFEGNDPLKHFNALALASEGAKLNAFEKSGTLFEFDLETKEAKKHVLLPGKPFVETAEFYGSGEQLIVILNNNPVTKIPPSVMECEKREEQWVSRKIMIDSISDAHNFKLAAVRTGEKEYAVIESASRIKVINIKTGTEIMHCPQREVLDSGGSKPIFTENGSFLFSTSDTSTAYTSSWRIDNGEKVGVFDLKKRDPNNWNLYSNPMLVGVGDSAKFLILKYLLHNEYVIYDVNGEDDLFSIPFPGDMPEHSRSLNHERYPISDEGRIAIIPESETSLQVVSFATKKTIFSMANCSIRNTAIIDQGKTIVTSKNTNTLEFYEVSNGLKRYLVLDIPVKRIVANTKSSRILCLAEDGRGVLVESDGTIVNRIDLSNIFENKETTNDWEFRISPDNGTLLAFKTAIYGRSDRFCVFDLLKFEILRSMSIGGKQLLEASFSPDSRFIQTISDENSWQLWDIATGTNIVTRTNLTGEYSLVVDQCGNLDVCGFAKDLFVTDPTLNRFLSNGPRPPQELLRLNLWRDAIAKSTGIYNPISKALSTRGAALTEDDAWIQISSKKTGESTIGRIEERKKLRDKTFFKVKELSGMTEIIESKDYNFSLISPKGVNDLLNENKIHPFFDTVIASGFALKDQSMTTQVVSDFIQYRFSNNRTISDSLVRPENKQQLHDIIINNQSIFKAQKFRETELPLYDFKKGKAYQELSAEKEELFDDFYVLAVNLPFMCINSQRDFNSCGVNRLAFMDLDHNSKYVSSDLDDKDNLGKISRFTTGSNISESRGRFFYYQDSPRTTVLIYLHKKETLTKIPGFDLTDVSIEVFFNQLETKPPATAGFYRRDALVSNFFDTKSITSKQLSIMARTPIDNSNRIDSIYPHYFVTKLDIEGVELSPIPHANLVMIRVTDKLGKFIAAFGSSDIPLGNQKILR